MILRYLAIGFWKFLGFFRVSASKKLFENYEILIHFIMDIKNLEKYFKMGKLKQRDLNISSVLDMINIIQRVDTDGFECYEKSWITGFLRPDEVAVCDLGAFPQKQRGFFAVKGVLDKEV